MQNPGIKDVKQYEALLRRGYSKEKSAEIVNGLESREKSRNAKPYEEWTKDELYEQARKVGVEGRSYMNKKNLIKSLSNN